MTCIIQLHQNDCIGIESLKSYQPNIGIGTELLKSNTMGCEIHQILINHKHITPMEILHLTPETDGYEIVTLLAHKVNHKNSLHVIEKDKQVFMTGGFLLTNSPEIRKVLDEIPKKDQYNFVQMMRTTPYVKSYYQNEIEEQMDTPLVRKRRYFWSDWFSW